MNIQSINQFNQSIYLHQTTWIHITIKENTRNDRIKDIKKKSQKNKKIIISKKYTDNPIVNSTYARIENYNFNYSFNY